MPLLLAILRRPRHILRQSWPDSFVTAVTSRLADALRDRYVLESELGWGVNFDQSDNFIFATFFIFGADQQPTWYSGELTLGANSPDNAELRTAKGICETHICALLMGGLNYLIV